METESSWSSDGSRNEKKGFTIITNPDDAKLPEYSALKDRNMSASCVV
jgi:hypothetical protein